MKGEARIRGPLESSLRGVSRPIFHPSRLLHGGGLHSLVDEDWLGDVLGHCGGRVGGCTAGVERAMSGAAEGCGKRQATSENSDRRKSKSDHRRLSCVSRGGEPAQLRQHDRIQKAQKKKNPGRGRERMANIKVMHSTTSSLHPPRIRIINRGAPEKPQLIRCDSIANFLSCFRPPHVSRIQLPALCYIFGSLRVADNCSSLWL